MKKLLPIIAITVVSGCAKPMEEYENSLTGETARITLASPSLSEYRNIPMYKSKTAYFSITEFAGCTGNKENSGKKLLGTAQIYPANPEKTYKIPANKELQITSSAAEDVGGAQVSCSTTLKFQSEPGKYYKLVFFTDNRNSTQCSCDIFEVTPDAELPVQSAVKLKSDKKRFLVPKSLNLCKQ